MSGGHLKGIQDAIRLYIRPALGHIRLKDLDTHMVQNLLNDLALRYSFVHRKCDLVITEALNRAVFLDHLGISPKVRKPWRTPPQPPSDTSIPTIEEGRRYVIEARRAKTERA
jgi:hypothetical protein